LTSLRKLQLLYLGQLKTLPSTIGALTGLEELCIQCCGLKDMPRSIEALTALQTLTVRSSFLTEVDFRPIQTLSCALPSLQQLRHLTLAGAVYPFTVSIAEHVLAIGRSLKAWPPPLLMHLSAAVQLGTCWRELGLPAEAAAWENAEILDFFRAQQEKVVAFASGMQARLGAASCVSSLNELALVMIADEVLGGWTLRRQWAREGACEGEEARHSPSES